MLFLIHVKYNLELIKILCVCFRQKLRKSHLNATFLQEEGEYELNIHIFSL